MKLHFTLLLLLSSICMAAQEPQDTIMANELQEIVVQAPKVIRKADMDLYYPSQSAIANSKNGMQIIQNLMIPSVTVNEILGSITTAGQSVQLRINGREATVEQIKNLLPETIKRVEWMDNPGLRYNGATAVLNFIVTNPTLGGSLMTNAQQALNTPFGNYNLGLKLNNGRSQWGAGAHYKLTNKVASHREYQETFTRPDGQTLTRTETPTGGHMSDNWYSLQLDYSYMKPDTTVLWVALHGYKRLSGASMFNGLMTQSNNSSDILLHDLNDNNGFTPSISAYLEQHFSNNQLIAIDANASFYNGRSWHNYTERIPQTLEYITDVNTSIKDNNQAYGITADYIKKWQNSKITTGVSYTANRNKSKHENLDNQVFHQHQDKLYIYAEYFQRIKKVTLTAGLGTQYTSFKFMETSQGNDSWNIRPQATVTYRPSNSSSFSLNFTSWQSAPSLSETNIAPQQLDGFQWQIGNPNLKTSTSYMLTLRYSFTFPRVYGQFGIRAFSSPNAITPYMYWHDNKLITGYENSKGLQNLSFWLSPQIEAIPNWLTVSGTLQYRAERMRGTGYNLYNHNWYGDVTAMVQHWGFTLIAQYQRAAKTLWGESISWGETISLIGLSYNWKKWEFSAAVLCPFTKYDRGSKSLNRYNSNNMHIRTDMTPMPLLQARYNLQWGRQKRGVNKLVNADADVNTSSASGR